MSIIDPWGLRDVLLIAIAFLLCFWAYGRGRSQTLEVLTPRINWLQERLSHYEDGQLRSQVPSTLEPVQELRAAPQSLDELRVQPGPQDRPEARLSEASMQWREPSVPAPEQPSG